MVKEMKNDVVVEGILSEIGLETATYTDASGRTHECVRGDLTVRVVQEIEKGTPKQTLEVPVRFFTKKYTNAGNENSAYNSLVNIIHDGRSIAVVGEDDADCVRITGARIVMQEYYSPDGRLITYPSISGSFVNSVRRSELSMKARFECDAVIAKMGIMTDKDGAAVEPQTLQIKGIVVGYNEYTDIIPFVTRQKDIIAGLQAAYAEDDTITLSGLLNFSSRTETYFVPVEIGDPIEKQRTIRVSEAFIRGASPRTSNSEVYEAADIAACLKKRTDRLANIEAKSKNRSTGAAPRTKGTQKAKIDIGF